MTTACFCKRNDLIYEQVKVIGYGKTLTTGLTANEVEDAVFKGFDSSLFATGFKASNRHDHTSSSLVSKTELLSTCCLRNVSSIVSTRRMAARMMA